jgi:hypothetical protein
VSGPLAEAGDLARGVLRLLADLGCEGLDEVSLANNRRADVLALDAKGRIVIVEIKTSEADFRADTKWPDYLEFCDFFYFAVPAGFPDDLLPSDHGLIVADRYGGSVVRPAPERRLAAARRKAVTLKLARMTAARLRRLIDPGP